MITKNIKTIISAKKSLLFDFLKRYKTVQSLSTLKIIIKITLERLEVN